MQEDKFQRLAGLGDAKRAIDLFMNKLYSTKADADGDQGCEQLR